MSADDNETLRVTMSEHELLTFAMLAHEADITLNEWFMNAIRKYLDNMENDDVTPRDTS